MMEKSGCLQLTREEYETLRTFYSPNDKSNEELTKASCVIWQKLVPMGFGYLDVQALFEAGEYRIVED